MSPHVPAADECASRTLASICAWLLAVAPLQAATILTLDFDSNQQSTNQTGVTGRLIVDFQEDAAGDFLGLTIENTTSASLGSRLTAVGFELPAGLADPTFAAGGTGSFFDQISYDLNVNPSSFNAGGGYDVMVTSDGNFNGGSPNGSPSAGGSQSVRLALGNTAYTPDQLRSAFADFYGSAAGAIAVARFQDVGGNTNDTVLGSLSALTPVPEPHYLLLLTLTAFTMGSRRRTSSRN